MEIGPGRGALTRLLVERYPLVRAVELDRSLAGALSGRLGRPPGLEVVAADALEVDLDELAPGGPWLWAGNLPYSVATPIVRRLAMRPELVAVAVLMVQLEVAARMCAGPGDAARGFLSIVVESALQAELVLEVPPRCFDPPPHVTSAVVRLVPRVPGAPREVIERALELAAGAFTRRRKKLANALALGFPAREAGARLAELGLDPDARPQDVPLAGWLLLGQAFPARERA